MRGNAGSVASFLSEEAEVFVSKCGRSCGSSRIPSAQHDDISRGGLARITCGCRDPRNQRDDVSTEARRLSAELGLRNRIWTEDAQIAHKIRACDMALVDFGEPCMRSCLVIPGKINLDHFVPVAPLSAGVAMDKLISLES